MSDFALQLGDLATRLSRALGITGRIPTSLRDPVMPVAMITNMAQPPFADEPGIFGNFLAQTGAAGQQGYVGFLAVAPRTVVRRCIVWTVTGSGNIAAVVFRQASGMTLIGNPYGSLNLQSRPFGQAKTAQANTSVGLVGNPAVTVGALGLTVDNPVEVVPNGSVVLYPGDLFVVNGPVAAAVNANITIDEYAR